MSKRSLASALLLICIACKPAPKSATTATTSTAGPAGPRVRATVVTIETALQPANKTLTHTITIANDRARSSDELDSWRLFDLKKHSVTFVDDIAKTYRTETLDALAKKQREAAAHPLPDGMAAAQYAAGATKAIAGVEARQSTIRLGTYQRDLWIGVHPQIPPDLFALMHASATPGSPYAGMGRAFADALLQTKGFPLEDHAEMAYGDRKLVIDRKVAKVEQQEVPASLLEIPRDYKDVTAPPAPPVSSRAQRGISPLQRGAGRSQAPRGSSPRSE